jgi:hypothetical protein
MATIAGNGLGPEIHSAVPRRFIVDSFAESKGVREQTVKKRKEGFLDSEEINNAPNKKRRWFLS